MHPGSAQLKSQNASPILHVPVFSSCLKLILNFFFFWIDITASSVMVFLFVLSFFLQNKSLFTISLSLPLIFFFFTFLSCLLFLQEVVHPFFHLFRL